MWSSDPEHSLSTSCVDQRHLALGPRAGGVIRGHDRDIVALCLKEHAGFVGRQSVLEQPVNQACGNGGVYTAGIAGLWREKSGC